MIEAIKNKIPSILIVAFVTVSLIEAIAEFQNNKQLVWLFKPLLMPLLFLYYIKTTKKVNTIFVVALLFSWIANLFFIERDFDSILLGSLFFLVYRTLIIYLVFKMVKMPTIIPFLLGAIPFIFIYITTCFMTYDVMGNGLFLFIIHGVFVITLGGYSLGSYIMNSEKSDMYLFISTILFAISQFIFVFKLYTEYDFLLHSIVMLMFVFAQYFLVKFILIQDEAETGCSLVANTIIQKKNE